MGPEDDQGIGGGRERERSRMADNANSQADEVPLANQSAHLLRRSWDVMGCVQGLPQYPLRDAKALQENIQENMYTSGQQNPG